MTKTLLLTCAVVLIAACTDQPSQTTDYPVKSVKTLEISNADLATQRTFSGTIESANTSQVSFRVSGLVNSVNVQAGDSVQKGQTLASLEPREFNLNLQSAQAELASARADLGEKTEDLNRQKMLKERGFIAQAAVDQAQAAFNTSNSRVVVAENNLTQAQNDLTYTTLVSPISGTVVSKMVDPFMEITAGQAMFELQTDNELQVKVLMPESLISNVDYGDIVNVSFPSVEVQDIRASVKEIGVQSNASSGFPVTVELAQAPDSLKAGMTARVAFNLGEASETNVYLIPITALDTRLPPEAGTVERGQAPVMVVRDGIAQRQIVRIRDIRGNSIEVIEGLKEGDQVIVAGVSFIQEGEEVKVWTPNLNLSAVINY